jgi:hypothetical protein
MDTPGSLKIVINVEMTPGMEAAVLGLLHAAADAGAVVSGGEQAEASTPLDELWLTPDVLREVSENIELPRFKVTSCVNAVVKFIMKHAPGSEYEYSKGALPDQPEAFTQVTLRRDSSSKVGYSINAGDFVRLMKEKEVRQFLQWGGHWQGYGPVREIITLVLLKYFKEKYA